MKLLRAAENETACLKLGLLGFAGSGKTRTATEVAIGLVNETEDDRPVAFFDTERGSDFMKPLLDAQQIPLVVHKGRAFSDLLTVVDEAEGTCSVLIIDSISHVWKEVLEAFQARFRVSRLAMHHWGPIKREWAQFTDRFLDSDLHIIICGRAGFEYDYEEDEEGKRELIKTGVKMKAETEMGYEPHLLVELTRHHRMEIEQDPDARGLIHRAFVIKDRWDVMDGMQSETDHPTYEFFRPHIMRLNLGGEHRGIDTSRNSQAMFTDTSRSRSARKRAVDIALEEITQALILGGINGTGKAETQQRTALLVEVFGTSSKTALSAMSLEKLQAGLQHLREELGQVEGEGPDELDEKINDMLERARELGVLDDEDNPDLESQVQAVLKSGDELTKGIALGLLTDKVLAAQQVLAEDAAAP